MTEAAGTEPTRRPFWRRALRLSTMAVAAATFAGLAVAGISVLHMRAAAEIPAAANPPINVNIETVRLEQSYPVIERFAGRLEAKRHTRLAFERRGLVTEILFDEGDKIEKGVVVARLDTSKLEAERARLSAQRRELDAKLALARLTMQRQTDLKDQGYRSLQKYDEARFAVDENAAAIDANVATIRSIDVDISKSALRAPFPGTVAERMIDDGAVVDAGAAVLDLLETGAAAVRVGVAVDAAKSLTVGQTYRLEANNRRLEGTLVALRPDLAMGTRTSTALFDVPSDETVPFGEIVELVLEREIPSPGYWLPATALSEGRKGLWSVFVIAGKDSDDHVPEIARETVEVLHTANDKVFVRGTLRSGARVVVQGTNRIVPGQQVAIKVAE